MTFLGPRISGHISVVKVHFNIGEQDQGTVDPRTVRILDRDGTRTKWGRNKDRTERGRIFPTRWGRGREGDAFFQIFENEDERFRCRPTYPCSGPQLYHKSCMRKFISTKFADMFFSGHHWAQSAEVIWTARITFKDRILQVIAQILI